MALTSESQRVRLVTAVSGDFFDELGVPILPGRGFTPEEDRVPGRDAVAVSSYGLWQQLFNGDPNVVGRQVSIGNHWFTVVGVTDKSYTGMYQRDLPNERAPTPERTRSRTDSELDDEPARRHDGQQRLRRIEHAPGPVDAVRRVAKIVRLKMLATSTKSTSRRLDTCPLQEARCLPRVLHTSSQTLRQFGPEP